MNIVVLDASAAVPAVMEIDRGPQLLQAIDSFEAVIAPELYVAEVASGLWKYVGAGQISIDTAMRKLVHALNLVDAREPIAKLAEDALREAAARRHSVYDLFYIVLARREGATLLTLDNRMRALAQSMNVETV